MTAAETGTERLRGLLEDDPNIDEKKMFGGIAFMLNGNMLCGYTSRGEFMARVGKDLEPEALAQPGARPFDYTGRKMGGIVLVDDQAIETDAELQKWIALATRFVANLPAK